MHLLFCIHHGFALLYKVAGCLSDECNSCLRLLLARNEVSKDRDFPERENIGTPLLSLLQRCVNCLQRNPLSHRTLSAE